MPILEVYGLFKQPNTNKRGSFTWNERSLQLWYYLNNKAIPDLVTSMLRGIPFPSCMLGKVKYRIAKCQSLGCSLKYS